MKDKVSDEFEQVRREVLQKQRVCSWCGHVAETSSGLVRHVLEKCRPPQQQDERDLLAKLQKENAK